MLQIKILLFFRTRTSIIKYTIYFDISFIHIDGKKMKIGGGWQWPRINLWQVWQSVLLTFLFLRLLCAMEVVVVGCVLSSIFLKALDCGFQYLHVIDKTQSHTHNRTQVRIFFQTKCIGFHITSFEFLIFSSSFKE